MNVPLSAQLVGDYIDVVFPKRNLATYIASLQNSRT